MMRLPFTFGLSGALHVAVLSSLALPSPPVTQVSVSSIQVRLLPSRVTWPSVTAMSEARADSALSPVSEGRIPNKVVVPRPMPALSPPSALAPITLPEDIQTVTKPTITNAIFPSDPASVSNTVVTTAGSSPEEVSASNTPDTQSQAVDGSTIADDNGAEVNTVQSQADTDQDSVPANPDGTIDSPFNVPKVLYSPLRKYPEEARWERRTGQGSLGFRLKADGSVDGEIKVLRSSGHADLDATAIESLRRWRFSPPPGAAPSSWYRYPFRFEIS